MTPVIEPQIPDVVLERLALYHCFLQEWIMVNKDKPITSKEMAQILGLTDETVRRDLSFLSKTGGKPGVGYNVIELYELLSSKLKLEERLPIIFVGNLGLLEGLTDVLNFGKFGFVLEGVYSENPDDTGKLYYGLKVRPLEELTKDSIPSDCRLAVVMVHPQWLNFALNKLKEAGIKGVLNLTPSVVTPFPDGVDGIQIRYPCYLKVLQFKTLSKK